MTCGYLSSLEGSGRRQGPTGECSSRWATTDGDKESNIRVLTAPSKRIWIQLPVERYRAALPTLRQGVIAGVFRNKPWVLTRAEKLQSVFLPNDLSSDDWYAGVYALPTVWPDVSMLGHQFAQGGRL